MEVNSGGAVSSPIIFTHLTPKSQKTYNRHFSSDHIITSPPISYSNADLTLLSKEIQQLKTQFSSDPEMTEQAEFLSQRKPNQVPVESQLISVENRRLLIEKPNSPIGYNSITKKRRSASPIVEGYDKVYHEELLFRNSSSSFEPSSILLNNSRSLNNKSNLNNFINIIEQNPLTVNKVLKLSQLVECLKGQYNIEKSKKMVVETSPESIIMDSVECE
ncbi:hypothetical protein WA026_006620 [Henosepilachna vigintioctopunctata]|uniref:Uncharacterized protein n=1 Tax=Henosepilachna vigintioctopunctata TaxID=420089 RepID=A0AAW1U7B0_9CUCU